LGCGLPGNAVVVAEFKLLCHFHSQSERPSEKTACLVAIPA
jgi:hypothetical protein